MCILRFVCINIEFRLSIYSVTLNTCRNREPFVIQILYQILNTHTRSEIRIVFETVKIIGTIMYVDRVNTDVSAMKLEKVSFIKQLQTGKWDYSRVT